MPQKKVLIVDDHPSIRSYLTSLIDSDPDFVVCGEAVDGEEGIEIAKRVVPDIILLDFSMPVMNGAQAAPILKKLLPGVPIILFTLHEDSVGKALAAAINVDRVMAKPDGMLKLVECMRSVLGLDSPQPSSLPPLELAGVAPVDADNNIPLARPTDEKPPTKSPC